MGECIDDLYDIDDRVKYFVDKAIAEAMRIKEEDELAAFDRAMDGV